MEGYTNFSFPASLIKSLVYLYYKKDVHTSYRTSVKNVLITFWCSYLFLLCILCYCGRSQVGSGNVWLTMLKWSNCEESVAHVKLASSCDRKSDMHMYNFYCCYYQHFTFPQNKSVIEWGWSHCMVHDGSLLVCSPAVWKLWATFACSACTAFIRWLQK